MASAARTYRDFFVREIENALQIQAQTDSARIFANGGEI
jgi:hypothetical protein